MLIVLSSTAMLLLLLGSKKLFPHTLVFSCFSVCIFPQLLCVRSDLQMTKGKVCAQVGHATLGAITKYLISPRSLLMLKPLSSDKQVRIGITSTYWVRSIVREIIAIYSPSPKRVERIATYSSQHPIFSYVYYASFFFFTAFCVPEPPT